jgi:hypothetical protein
MKERLIKFETEKLAHEKGFTNIQKVTKRFTREFVDNKGDGIGEYYYQDRIIDENVTPTQSLLQKQLRDKNIDITVITDYKKGCRVYYVGFSFVNDKNKVDIWFSKDEDKNKIEYSGYEDALEVGLFESLKTIVFNK